MTILYDIVLVILHSSAFIMRGVSVILSTPLAPLCVMPQSSTAAQITSDTLLKQFKGPVHPKKKFQWFRSEGVLTAEDRSCQNQNYVQE